MAKKTTVRPVPRAPQRARSPMYLHRAATGHSPRIRRAYDAGFRPDAAYLASLPDMMAAAHAAVPGAAVQQVGVSNFRLPLRIRGKGGRSQMLEASVTGMVSLEAELKGINMSRIVRSFYDYRDETFTTDTAGRILRSYLRRVGSKAARLRLTFSYPILQRSLRSGLRGYQYYRAGFEGVMDAAGGFRRFVHFDFIYSSACPAAAELAEHARDRRQVYGVPHSQRSKARLVLEVARGRTLWLEDVHAACVRALQTETQVMVKREDEQAFAELNGTHLKFVEDAARLLYREFNGDSRVVDFQIACAHFESLHSHDAVSVICKGVKGGLQADFMDFPALAG